VKLDIGTIESGRLAVDWRWPMYGGFFIRVWPWIRQGLSFLAAYQEVTDVWRWPLIEVPKYSSIKSKFTMTIETYYDVEVYYGPDW